MIVLAARNQTLLKIAATLLVLVALCLTPSLGNAIRNTIGLYGYSLPIILIWVTRIEEGKPNTYSVQVNFHLFQNVALVIGVFLVVVFALLLILSII